MYTIGYPQPVEDYANKIVEHNAVKDLMKSNEINPKCLFELVCEVSVQNYLKSGDTIISFTEMSECIDKSIVKTAIVQLEEEGMMFNVANDGEAPKYVITDKGRIEANRNFDDVN